MTATPECPERLEINIFLMIPRLDSQVVAVAGEVLATLTHQHSLRAMWAVLQTEEKAVRIMSKEEPYPAQQENKWEAAEAAVQCKAPVITAAVAAYISVFTFEEV